MIAIINKHALETGDSLGNDEVVRRCAAKLLEELHEKPELKIVQKEPYGENVGPFYWDTVRWENFSRDIYLCWIVASKAPGSEIIVFRSLHISTS